MARTLLAVQAAMGLIYGILLVLDPPKMAEYMGLGIVRDDGTAELVTMYFGMSGALSCLFLAGALRPHLTAQMIWLLAIFISGVALGRSASFLLLETGSYTLSALAYDVPASLLSWFAVSRLPPDGV